MMTARQFTYRRRKFFGTQAKAAEALGVTQGAICHWERGIRPVPRYVEIMIKREEEKWNHGKEKTRRSR